MNTPPYLYSDNGMLNYFRLKCQPKDLFPGSNEIIIEKLKFWVARRKDIYKGQMDCKYQSLKSLLELYKSPDISLEPDYIGEILSRKVRAKDLENERTVYSARAIYLLNTLKSRGFTWPDLWWRPDIDGAVCSLLGTVDIDFDAEAKLTMLEARENRERLQAFEQKMASVVYDDFAALKARLGNILSKEDIKKIVLALKDPSNEDEYRKSPMRSRWGPNGPINE